MTREERAQRWLADYFDRHGKHGGADELRDGRMITMTSITAVNAMLAFADAEAAAMRERAAGVAKAYGHDVAGWNSAEQNAAEKIEARIRALPATGEVGS